MSLEIVDLVKVFGAVRAVDGVSLSVAGGEFFTLLGPSGCGKTTLLRLIAGIYTASNGSVRLNGRDITAAPMHKRNLAMVFQSFALFPHLSVFDNVAFGLRSRHVPREEIRQRVKEALTLVKLDALAERFPAQLSGDSSNASRSPARSSCGPIFFSSTSPSAISTHGCAMRCASKSATCSAASASPRYW